MLGQNHMESNLDVEDTKNEGWGIKFLYTYLQMPLERGDDGYWNKVLRSLFVWKYEEEVKIKIGSLSYDKKGYEREGRKEQMA